MKEGYPSSSGGNRWIYITVILFCILIFVVSIFTNVVINVQTQLATLERHLLDYRMQLENLDQQFEILEYINYTNVMPWPAIYNQVKQSIVLIQTDGGLGSGFVYNLEGYIVTNFHVVQDAATIQVTFMDGNVTTAIKIGDDPYSDLAVIKVNREDATLHPIVMGNSSTLSVGEPVAALGNPFGLSDTITAGIVSALGRELEAPGGFQIVDVIQVDAAINPGNSGGPLVNLKGQVVGVNTAIITSSGTFAGVGFAIPTSTVSRELPALIENGTYEHPWVGIAGVDVDLEIAADLGLDTPHGFYITRINSTGPAEKAGLQIGDVIVGIDGHAVKGIHDLAVYVEREKKPGDQITLTIVRDRQQVEIILILGIRPPPT